MHVSQLVLYPVKSCAGLPVTCWPLELTGLRHDRSFMVVDPEGRFLTQREEPSLARVRPVLSDAALTLHTPFGSPVTLPLRPVGRPRTVTVWEHTGTAVDTGDEAAELLSSHLGRPVRLVAAGPELRRTVPGKQVTADHPVTFADGFPLLLTGESSLADLNSRLRKPLPMARFRPNIVVSAAAPYAEDGWAHIRVGQIDIDVVKPCARCTITTVDPATGRRDGGEPLATLGTYRRGERGVLFGQNAVPRITGEISVGDPVRVLE